MQTVVSDKLPAPAAGAAAHFPATEVLAKDAIIGWFRGEFAAANAIIDALCGHLAQLDGRKYDGVFMEIHKRRLNWIPILQMQKYHSIANVAIELKRVAANAKKATEDEKSDAKKVVDGEEAVAEKEKLNGNENGEAVEGEEDSPDSDITDGGSQENQASLENNDICSNHEECASRPGQIKLTKGFIAKEPVKGHMVNVVKGLKLFDNAFTEPELTKLNDFVYDLRLAGQNGELPGETFKIFNQQIKGNKRELIQFGVPIFRQIREQNSAIDPIPPFLQSVIDHMIQWRLIPSREPNSCIINYFDEGEFSQPYIKPPHVDQPITTLLLSESTMAFGCTLVNDNEGNYKAPQILSLKEGSLLVMRGNSADVAAHAMCPSPSKRATITFFRVRPETNQNRSLTVSPPPDTTMTLWQPAPLNPYAAMQNVPLNVPIRPPMLLLAPACPMVLSPRRIPPGGTGVFLPWNGNARKHTRHLPPRAQKGRMLALPSSVQKPGVEPTSDSGSDSGGLIQVKVA